MARQHFGATAGASPELRQQWHQLLTVATPDG